MSNVPNLVASIIHFLSDQMQSGQLSSDAVESLEVAVQCLESAYSISASDESLRTETSLLDIFNSCVPKGELVSNDSLPPEATPEEKAEAEKLKNEGNALMREEKFSEAIDCYSRAIALDGRNAIYFCNRAAVHSKLNNHQNAINDAQQALKIDPSYGKAYARLGLAYANLGQHEEARNAYAQAVEMEPSNESYKNNLELATEKLSEQMFSGGPSNFASPNFAPPNFSPFNNILGNSDLMSMASQVLADPSMQNMLSNIVSGNMQQGGSSMDALLRAGQQLAQHMQSANPELVEQLRRQLETQGGPGGPVSDGSGGDGEGPQPPPAP